MATLFLSDEGLKAFDEMTIYESDAEIGLETLVQPTSNDQALDFTEIGFAKPAVDKDALILTIDLSFDDFDDSLLDIFSKILGSACAIPAFSAYSPYLLVAGKLTNLGKDIGNRILDSKPEISLDAKLYFRRAG